MPDGIPPFGGVAYQPDDTRGWAEIDLGGPLGRPADGRPVPFQIFVNRFSSSSEQSELFLHDPLQQMKGNPGELARLNVAGHSGADLQRLPVEQLRETWPVTTFIANHHRPFTALHVYAVTLVGPDGVHVMLYKHASDAQNP